MKKSILAVGALLSSTSGVHAVTVWQGNAIVDTVTAQCSADTTVGLKVDSVLRSVLRPKNVSDNGGNTSVWFLSNQQTMFSMVLDGGAMPSGTAAVFGNDASGLIKANVGVVYSGFVQTPAAIAATDINVRLRGTIRNFLYITGCTITFHAAYTKRSD